MTTVDEMKLIQKKLYEIANEHISPTEKESLLATGGCMMKVALELYSVVMNDEDIMGMLEFIKGNLPTHREQMRDKLGDRTVH
jgi:hypothetical protein